MEFLGGRRKKARKFSLPPFVAHPSWPHPPLHFASSSSPIHPRKNNTKTQTHKESSKKCKHEKKEQQKKASDDAKPNLGTDSDVLSVVEASPRTSSGMERVAGVLSPNGLAEQAPAPGVFRTARPSPNESGCHRGSGFRREQNRTWRARDPRSDDVDTQWVRCSVAG